MAITAIAAIASAGAVAEGIIAVETLATIATVTSIVGAVTGSKELKSLGAGMGIGAFGAGLMGLGTAAEGAAGVAGSASESVGGASNAAAGAESATDSAAGAGAITSPVSDPSAGITSLDAGGSMASASPVASESAMPVADMGTSAASSAAPTSAATPAASATDIAAPSAPSAPNGPMSPDAPQSPWSTPTPSPMDAAVKTAVDNNTFANSKGYFGDMLGKVGTWVDGNKTLAAGMMNMAGGAMQGAAKAYEADRNYGINKSLLEMKQQEMRNASAQPTINMTVNPNAAVFSNPPQQYNGIIAGARGK